jgi:membrane-bound lytic murein transglycosylase D
MTRFWFAAGVLALLSACGGTVRHIATPELPVVQAPKPLPPHPVSDGNALAIPDGSADVWNSVVAGRSFTDCDYAPGIDSWARRVAGSPARFNAELGRVAPWVDWVWREAQALGLPAEAALLPLVESGYRPVIGGFGAPGGWWQIMPGTAKVLGLRVERGRDDRMDPLAATLAALGMLRQLGDRYESNWLLAMVAYNVGPLNVDRWIKRSGIPIADLQRVEQLPAPKVTINHLHRMMAFGCLLAQPQRYGLELPSLAQRDRLDRVHLKQSIPTAAVPAALGERGTEWRAQHPQLMKLRTLQAGRALLAPADLHSRLRALGSLAPFDRAPIVTKSSTEPAAKPGKRAAASAPEFHSVQSRDSLWLIARRYDLRVRDLLALNPKLNRRSVLRLKQKIRLR